MGDILDVENFEELDNMSNQEDRIINGEPLYYSTGQVAERLNELPSTVRYWCDEYDEFLNIERVGKAGTKRRFTDLDIKQLEYIKYLLKQEKFSIQQAKEFLSSPEANKLEPIEKPKDQLMVEALAKIVSYEVMNSFMQLKDEIMDNLNSQDAKNDNFHEKTEKSLLDISESSMKYQKELLEVIDSFKNDLNEREKRLTEKEDELRLKIEELEKSQVESKNAAENNGGFFSKLFGRKQ